MSRGWNTTRPLGTLAEHSARSKAPRGAGRQGWQARAAPANAAAMGDPRIIAIDLDERSIIRRNEDIEQEKRVAVFDLLEGNHFALPGQDGPFRVVMRVEDSRLAIDVRDEAGAAIETVRLGLARFR